MWRLIDRWDAHEQTRAEVARLLLSDWEGRKRLPQAAHDLLGTFEVLGYLVMRSKTLSLEDAWINFSGPAIQWWFVFRPGIQEMQKEDPTMYEDFERLVEKLIKLDAKKRSRTVESLTPSDEDLRAFLRGVPSSSEDAGLDSDSQPG